MIKINLLNNYFNFFSFILFNWQIRFLFKNLPNYKFNSDRIFFT
jgi:hypothetical protein